MSPRMALSRAQRRSLFASSSRLRDAICSFWSTATPKTIGWMAPSAMTSRCLELSNCRGRATVHHRMDDFQTGMLLRGAAGRVAYMEQLCICAKDKSARAEVSVRVLVWARTALSNSEAFQYLLSQLLRSQLATSVSTDSSASFMLRSVWMASGDSAFARSLMLCTMLATSFACSANSAHCCLLHLAICAELATRPATFTMRLMRSKADILGRAAARNCGAPGLERDSCSARCNVYTSSYLQGPFIVALGRRPFALPGRFAAPLSCTSPFCTPAE